MGKGIIVYTSKHKTAEELKVLKSELEKIQGIDDVAKFEMNEDEGGHKSVPTEVLIAVLSTGIGALTTFLTLTFNSFVKMREQDKNQEIEIKKSDGSYIKIPLEYVIQEKIKIKEIIEKHFLNDENIEHIGLRHKD